MMDESSLDLDKLLEGVTPSMVTPQLGEITNLSNDRKPKQLARIIVTALHKRLGTPPTKEILHNGSIHQMRYFDIEPLMKGVWAEVSLLILPLSFGEQMALIDALYPVDVQLTAKAFAAHFSYNVPNSPITVKQDDTTRQLLEAVLSGVSMILATQIEAGYSIAHPDVAQKYLNDVIQTTKGRLKKEHYQKQMARKEASDQFKDRKA